MKNQIVPLLVLETVTITYCMILQNNEYNFLYSFIKNFNNNNRMGMDTGEDMDIFDNIQGHNMVVDNKVDLIT
jgi:hypothetical protein